MSSEDSAITDNQPSQSLLSDDTNRLHRISTTISDPYQNSLCGAILNCIPTKAPSAIFTYIRHSNFQALHRSLDVYHQEIVRIRNDNGQVSSSLPVDFLIYAFYFSVERPASSNDLHVSLQMGPFADDAWL